MKIIIETLFVIVILITNLNCSSNKQEAFRSEEVYKSENLIITQISENAFVHTSFLQTQDFGHVPCNGLIVSSNKETIVFDTPTNDKSSEELINWIQETLHSKINAIIPTHFHNDCLGSLQAFHNRDITSYANSRTTELAKENDYVIPINSFNDSLILKVGNENIIVKYFGEGHTKDNVVGYFPSENILFGGCLIKELNASKGYLGDANVADWSSTVKKIKMEYSNVKIVVPGHGKFGDHELLDYTINLFH
jgi:metallo-beta-lactamase class B